MGDDVRLPALAQRCRDERYLMRFVHMMPGLNRLQGIMRTTYNQYKFDGQAACEMA